jgi:hypothetical protein
MIMNQQKRIGIANDTLEILEAGFYTNRSGKKVERYSCSKVPDRFQKSGIRREDKQRKYH